MIKRDQKMVGFSIFGFIIVDNGKINEDICSKISIGGTKWRCAYEILYDRCIHQKLKKKSSRMIGKSTMIYSLEYPAIKKVHEDKLNVI